MGPIKQSIIGLLTLVSLLNVVLASEDTANLVSSNVSSAKCEHAIVQSMPDGVKLTDPPGVETTHVSLIDMAEKAKKTLRIASFYICLTAPEKFQHHPSVGPGKELMKAILDAAARGVGVEVLVDGSTWKEMSNPVDLDLLRQNDITVKHINMTRLLKKGVMHSKFMIADNETFYVGSSNFDWRSYTQIKEIGVTFRNCPALAEDLDKIFRTYMLMADEDSVPSKLSDDFKTQINLENPLLLDDGYKVFLSGAPPPFNGIDEPTGRTDDLDALLHVIDKARYRIDISVMNYSPRLEFGYPKKYWPRIDDALRRAAIERRVNVRLLFSDWAHSRPIELIWYRSLNAYRSLCKLHKSPQDENCKGGIHVKRLKVPSFDEFQESIDYARVKHDKYMVIDDTLYLGTSNWTPDYFINTCGVGVVFEPSSSGKPSGVVKVMQDIFDRDFESEYAHELPPLGD